MEEWRDLKEEGTDREIIHTTIDLVAISSRKEPDQPLIKTGGLLRARVVFRRVILGIT